MCPDRRKKAAKRKKKLAKRNKKAAKREKKAAKRKNKAMKRLRGSSGNRTFPQSSHGRNRLFPSSEIKRARWQFVTVRSTPRTTNQFQMTCTSVTRRSRIRFRRRRLGKGRLAMHKLRST